MEKNIKCNSEKIIIHILYIYTIVVISHVVKLLMFGTTHN